MSLVHRDSTVALPERVPAQSSVTKHRDLHRAVAPSLVVEEGARPTRKERKSEPRSRSAAWLFRKKNAYFRPDALLRNQLPLQSLRLLLRAVRLLLQEFNLSFDGVQRRSPGHGFILILVNLFEEKKWRTIPECYISERA